MVSKSLWQKKEEWQQQQQKKEQQLARIPIFVKIRNNLFHKG